MGASLVGYFLYLPNELKEEEVQAMRDMASNYRQAVDKGFENAPKLPDEFYDHADDLTTDEMMSKIRDEILPFFDGLLKPDDPDVWSCLEHNDVNYSTFTVSYRAIHVYFAGEMTWGDTPDGRGYEFIRMCVESGLHEMMYERIFRV